MADKDSMFGGLGDFLGTMKSFTKEQFEEFKDNPAKFLFETGGEAIKAAGMTPGTMPLVPTYVNPHFETINKIVQRAWDTQGPEKASQVYYNLMNALTPAEEAVVKKSGQYIPAMTHFIGSDFLGKK